MRLFVTGGRDFVAKDCIRYILNQYAPEFITNVETKRRASG